MKRRREAVATCEDCNKNFELHESANMHFLSRSHLQRLLAIKNASLMDSSSSGFNEQELNDQEHCWVTGDNLDSSDDEVTEAPETDDMDEIAANRKNLLPQNPRAMTSFLSQMKSFFCCIATRTVS